MTFDHDYSLTDRWLHRLALGIPSLAELTFDLDRKSSGADRRADDIAQLPHVFVTGLARAGTTAILRHLYASGCFRSLTYRDMPFPLAPNLWRRLSARWRLNRREVARAHGDGMGVDADSPEALEEVFWRIQSGADYIHANGLSPHEPDERTLALFRAYVALILAPAQEGQTRYLSKNNNNILRLSALEAAFPAALFVIPFRDPATHALSLWRQHMHFCALQTESPFVRSYMDWLVHHEFGAGHRPFLMGGPAATGLSPTMPDYWLDIWIRVYRTLAYQHAGRRLYICYEDLCTDPGIWRNLTERAGLPDAGVSRFFLKVGRQADCFDQVRLDQAKTLYRHLRWVANSVQDCDSRQEAISIMPQAS